VKISNIEVIRFRTTTQHHPSKWGYGRWDEPRDTTQTITKISTDDGAEGYMVGGDERIMEHIIKPMILGEDPLEREKIWNWMDQLVTFGHSLPRTRDGDRGLRAVGPFREINRPASECHHGRCAQEG